MRDDFEALLVLGQHISVIHLLSTSLVASAADLLSCGQRTLLWARQENPVFDLERLVLHCYWFLDHYFRRLYSGLLKKLQQMRLITNRVPSLHDWLPFLSLAVSQILCRLGVLLGLALDMLDDFQKLALLRHRLQLSLSPAILVDHHLVVQLG